jgi:uncharacterized protein (TIGR01244 family)
MAMRKIIIVTLVCLLFAESAAQDSLTIRNFTRIDKQVCAAGQPTMEQFSRLKAEGIRAVINLRHTSEPFVAEEEARAKEMGLRYFSIPVAYFSPKEEQADEFLKIMDDPQNRPVFIHCAAAIRVSAFWMIRRVLRDGWTVEKAEEEARRIGLHPQAEHLRKFALDYIERHKKK